MALLRKKNILIISLCTMVILILAAGRAAARPNRLPLSRGAAITIARPASQDLGLRLVYGETPPKPGTETKVWLNSVPQLAKKELLATILHAAGYPPVGTISPDGRKIGIFNLPAGTSSLHARTDGGEVWVADTDGGELKQVAGQAGYLGPWSPDSQWLVFGRLVPLDQPIDPQIPFRTELYRVSAGGQTTSLLFSDSRSYGVQPIGWSLDAGQFYVALLDNEGKWSILAQEAASGKTLNTWALPPLGTLRSIRMSADASEILVEHTQGETDSLNVYTLSPPGSNITSGKLLASAKMPGETQVSPVIGRWSARGQKVWLYQAEPAGITVRSQIVNPRGDLLQALPLKPDTAQANLLPAGWSPDERWFLWRSYPEIFTSAWLQAAGQSTLLAVPKARPENWITLYGWIGPGVQGGRP